MGPLVFWGIFGTVAERMGGNIVSAPVRNGLEVLLCFSFW